MKILKSSLKKTMENAKRVLKNQKEEKLKLIDIGERSKVVLIADSRVKEITYFRVLEVEKDEAIDGIEIDPIELSKQIPKGGDETLNFVQKNGKWVDETGKVELGITNKEASKDKNIDGLFDIVSNAQLKKLEDHKRFFEVLSNAYESIKGEKKTKGKDLDYVKISNEKAMTVQQSLIQMHRIGEEVDFGVGYVNVEACYVVEKSLGKKKNSEVLISSLGEKLVMKEGEDVFSIDYTKKKDFEDIRKLETITKDFEIHVDAEDVAKAIEKYNKSVSLCEFKIENDVMTITPRNDEFETHEVSIQTDGQGVMKERVLFSAKLLKPFMKGFKGPVTFKQTRYKNVKGEEIVVWQGYTKYKTAMLAAIHEPDFEKEKERFNEMRRKFAS